MAETYKRQCENWLLDFGRWTLPRSEAPESFIFWTGLFTIAAALRRRVYIPKKYLGSWECAPNLYIMFIAGAGRARKSTTANYVEDLLDEVPQITRSPEIITKESLLSTIVRSDDASMCITAPEFGEFIVKSGVEMYGFLTNAYDGKRRLAASTLSRGVELAERPCVNLLGATTPEWVADNMPESVIGGGFASRVIFIYEEKVRRRQFFYDEIVDPEESEQMRRKLVADINHISNNISGEFTFTPEAKEFAEHWYQTTADDGAAENYKLSGYYERRPAHMLKVAMCVHAARSDSLILEKSDLEEAITLLQQIEKKLPRTFQAIGRNPYTIDMGRILEFVEQRGQTTPAEVKQNFYHVAEPAKLDELIAGMIAMNRIKVVGGDDGKTYLAPTKNGRKKKYDGDPTSA